MQDHHHALPRFFLRWLRLPPSMVSRRCRCAVRYGCSDFFGGGGFGATVVSTVGGEVSSVAGSSGFWLGSAFNSLEKFSMVWRRRDSVVPHASKSFKKSGGMLESG